MFKVQSVFLLMSFLMGPLAQADLKSPQIGTLSTRQGDFARSLRYVYGIQNRDPNRTGDFLLHDTDILSPKSVKIHPFLDKVYVNSLEGFRTAVYRWSEDDPVPVKLKTIGHRFGEKNQHLFMDDNAPPSMEGPGSLSESAANNFNGKPVEMTFSHGGKYLWVTYYRRSYDRWAQYASGVAIIDTETDEIVRVMKTGSIAKVVTFSEEHQSIAVVNWGQNTVGLIDVASRDPRDWSYSDLLFKRPPSLSSDLAGSNRDRNCGLCLRGALFLPGSDILIVGAMSGGAVLGFNVNTGNYLGEFQGIPPTVRHIVYVRPLTKFSLPPTDPVISQEFLGKDSISFF